MKKVIHVIPSIAQEGSGPSYSVRRLSESLNEDGIDNLLVALEWDKSQRESQTLKFFPISFGPKALGISRGMKKWLVLQGKRKKLALIHNHGMWQFNSLYAGVVAKKFNIGYVVSPRGAFSDYAMSSGSRFKNIFWKIFQKPSFQTVNVFHATSRDEYHAIRRLGFTQPVAIIPNGVDIPAPVTRQSSPDRTIIFLGRIHPIKGLDMLLLAWAALQDSFPRWKIRIVGSDAGYYNDVGYLDKIKAMALELNLSRIEFSGALYGADKWAAYSSASLFVLSSYSENFGMSVAESLASGLPAVVTKGAPWAGLDSENAGRWVDTDVDSLITGMKELMELDHDVLRNMGNNGRQWMIREFSWKNVSKSMSNVYQWIASNEVDPPPSVVLD